MPRLAQDDEQAQEERRILEALGRRLRARRNDLGLTVMQAAERSGLSHSYHSRLERGLIPRPTLLELRKVSRGYGVPLHALIDDSGESPESAGVRGLRDAPALARVVGAIAGSWQWAGEDVRAVLLASLEGVANQLDAIRRRHESR